MGANQPKFVTKQDIEAFQRDSAVRLRGVFEQKWIDLVAAGVERVLANPSPFGEFLGGEDGSPPLGENPETIHGSWLSMFHDIHR